MMKVKVTDERNYKIAQKYGFKPLELEKLEKGDVVFITGSYFDMVLETASLTGIANDVMFIAPDSEETIDEFIREAYGLPVELLKDKEALQEFISFVRKTALALESKEIKEELENLKNIKVTLELHKIEQEMEQELVKEEPLVIWKSVETEKDVSIVDYKIFSCEGSKNVYVLIKITEGNEEYLKVLRISGYGLRTTDKNIKSKLKENVERFIKSEFNDTESNIQIEDITCNIFNPEPCEGYLLFLKHDGKWNLLIPNKRLSVSHIPLRYLGNLEDFYLLPLFEEDKKYIEGASRFSKFIETCFEEEKLKEKLRGGNWGEKWKSIIKKVARHTIKYAIFKDKGLHKLLDREDLTYLDEFLYSKINEYLSDYEGFKIYLKLQELLQSEKESEEDKEIYRVAIASWWKLFLKMMENETSKYLHEFTMEFISRKKSDNGDEYEDNEDFFISDENVEEAVTLKLTIERLISEFIKLLTFGNSLQPRRRRKNYHPRFLIFGVFWIASTMRDVCHHGDMQKIADYYTAKRGPIPCYFPRESQTVSAILNILHNELTEYECLELFREVLNKINNTFSKYGIPLEEDRASRQTILNNISIIKNLIRQLATHLIDYR